MRDFSTDELERISGPVTRSWFIVDITLDAEMHLATGGEAFWGETEYIKGHAKNLREGQNSISLSVLNEGGRFTMPSILGSYQRKPVKVWSVPAGKGNTSPLLEEGYVEDGYYEEPDFIVPLLVFSGHISEVRANDGYLDIVATRSAARRTPRLRVVPPFANWVAAPESVINFNGRVIRIRSRL